MQHPSLKLKTYIWLASAPDGKKVEGELQAYSINLAKLHLRKKGMIPLTIEIKKSARFIWPFQTITRVDIVCFFRQFAILFAAGIPIPQCFHILQQNQNKLSLQRLFHSLKTDIEAGKSLLTSISKFPRYFNMFCCHLIHLGESSGTLELALERIADYQEKSLLLKKQIQQALFYPAIILCTAVIISLLMLILVVPGFADLFQSMNKPLPLFTGKVIQFSHFLRNDFWFLFISLSLISILMLYLRSLNQFKRYFDACILKLPIFNTFYKKIFLTRLMRNLSVVFSAGLPINEALKLMAQTSNSLTYKNLILTAQQKVLAGQPLHIALQQNSLVNTLIIQMIKVGEESGTLDVMLEKIADIHQNDLESAITYLTRSLEPLIMIILGVLIGGILIAMYLPIFKLGTII